MNIKRLIFSSTLLAIMSITPVLADSNSWFSFGSSKPGVAPVMNDSYKEECGACHFAYQPGLLPARSWEKLFTGKSLENHFGENAELDEDARKSLLTYAVENAADNSSHKRSKKMNKSINSSDTPLRITDVQYFKKEHREIPKRLIDDNEKVKSLSYCDACHQQATKGVFEENTINIPGHGRWED